MTLAVRVIKTFNEVRTPCPPAGAIGEWYDIGVLYCHVRFPLPMIDQDGAVWESHGQDDDYMKLKFLPDEIELVDD